MSDRPPADGKRIEQLVSTIERLLLPEGFDVKTNTRLHDDNGVQLAEFDIEVRGRLGSGKVAWLIECRDRPSEGPAPGAWIEQLAGRRSRFNFDKVTAVSTTGFAPGAVTHAKGVGIELRAVDEISSEVSQWLRMNALNSQEERHVLSRAQLVLNELETTERLEAAKAAIGTKKLNEPQLRSTQTGATISPIDAFVIVVGENPQLWEGVQPNGEPKPVTLSVEYDSPDSHFVLDTTLGPVRIMRINYEGKLSVIRQRVPLSNLSQYRRVSPDEAVAQTAQFCVPVSGEEISVSIHRLIESGTTMLTISRTGEAGVPSPSPKDDKE